MRRNQLTSEPSKSSVNAAQSERSSPADTPPSPAALFSCSRVEVAPGVSPSESALPLPSSVRSGQSPISDGRAAWNQPDTARRGLCSLYTYRACGVSTLKTAAMYLGTYYLGLGWRKNRTSKRAPVNSNFRRKLDRNRTVDVLCVSRRDTLRLSGSLRSAKRRLFTNPCTAVLGFTKKRESKLSPDKENVHRLSYNATPKFPPSSSVGFVDSG